METSVRIVTKEHADAILLNNNGNRSIKPSRVKFYENALLKGEWKLTHQGIAISNTGRLLDGQHRLIAISNTGIPAQVMVTVGLDDNVFDVLDTGSARSAGDVLGIVGATHWNTTAVAIKLAILYEKQPNSMWNGKAALLASHAAILSEYKNNQDQWQVVVGVARKAAPIVTPGPFAACLWLAMLAGHDCETTLADFAELLKTGEMLTVGNPILAFRNRFISEKGGVKVSYSQQAKLADYIKLFNAYITNQQLKIFKVQQYPPMPAIVGSSKVF